MSADGLSTTTNVVPTSLVNLSDVVLIYDEMTASMSSVRQLIQSLKSKSYSEFDMKDGISLLSLKHNLMLSYMQSLVILSARKTLGHSLKERHPPPQPYSDVERDTRADGAGDLVDSMLEGRLALEKIKALEGRMRYQIDKLVKVAQEKEDSGKDIINDPLAFRPNPQNLTANDGEEDTDEEPTGGDKSDSIYRPPRVAPMPYVPTSTNTSAKEKRAERVHIPSTLRNLMDTDPDRPHVESTTGLGNTPGLSSARARNLKRITEFEEEQFGRIMMNKKDARRRRRDEEDLALGSGLAGISEDGAGGGSTGSRWRRGGGLADEFNDVLRDNRRAKGHGDGYDELRQKGKRGSVLERSRDNKPLAPLTDEDKKRKRTRFDQDRKKIKKRKT